jgi:hypothetical protein
MTQLYAKNGQEILRTIRLLWSRNHGCKLTLLLLLNLMSNAKRRTGAEESDSDVERETSSSTHTFSAQEPSESSTCSSSEASGDEGEPGSWCQERLLFEFLESEPPYQREPLADKACLSLTETHLVHHSQSQGSVLLV